MVIDRLLYAAVAVALASVLLFDPTFAENLARAFGEEIPPLPFGPWQTGGIALFAALALAALSRELRR